MQVFVVYLEIVDTEALKELKDIPVTLGCQVLMEQMVYVDCQEKKVWMETRDEFYLEVKGKKVPEEIEEEMEFREIED